MRHAIQLFTLLVCAAFAHGAQSRRVVIIKVDGLGAHTISRWLNDRDPKSGRSALPWIEHVFVHNGARLENFYVRGISLSVPSWSMLDTGYPLLIRGNAEFDRATGGVYDYLNFFPFYVSQARNERGDMPGVEVLDEAGIPLLLDAFRKEERLQGMQLFQRGVRWRTLKNILPRRFATRSIRQLFNEWQIGFEFTSAVSEQVEHELIAALASDRVMYLDYYFTDYDHVMHLANDETSERLVMQKLDALVGRIWNAIARSSMAQGTTLVLVSDHGMNTDPAIYSQGYNLISFFNSSQAGGHHVMTNRHPMSEYTLKGLDPFVSQVVTASKDSRYLNGEAESYPTALLDLDGNERASVYLRNSDVNQIHILSKEAGAAAGKAEKTAIGRELIEVVDRHRAQWEAEARDLDEEREALGRAIARLRARMPAKEPKFTPEQKADGTAYQWEHRKGELSVWESQFEAYGSYASWLRHVLKLTAEDVAAGSFRIALPRRAPFDMNRVHELQNYVVGRNAEGWERVNNFAQLTSIRVRNNVQPGVSAQPVDFVAAKLSKEDLRASLPESEWPDRDGVFLYGSEDRQALILGRSGAGGELLIRYLPVARLKQDAGGRITFKAVDASADFPLRYWEDRDFRGDAALFLKGWHAEREWFEAVCRTKYSNAIAGLLEQFGQPFTLAGGELWEGAAPEDERALRRFVLRLRRNAEADMLVLANDHWNFNTRGFNPGGNHGSFFQISTHSVLMLAGAGIPKGLAIEQPYDSLSFAPTILDLLGRGDASKMPGPVIGPLIERPEPASSTRLR